MGKFLHYPTKRITESCIAEIEDTKAYFCHKTPAGIRYAFDQKNIETVEELMIKALSYSKSHRNHISTDIEYAYYLAKYILAKNPLSELALLIKDDLQYYLNGLRSMEYYTHKNYANRVYNHLLFYKNIKKIEKKHQAIVGSNIDIRYDIYNDNRYEQYHYIWKKILE